MAVFGLGYRKALVDMRWAISLFICKQGLKKQFSSPIALPFLVMNVFLDLDR